MTESGFIDLRLSRQEGEAEEGFWPSFTDVMTVIVMIFIIAMVILLMRNMELLSQLRATMEAEREAAELARSTSLEKDSLALKLITTENELSMIRMQLMRSEEANERQAQRILEQRQNLKSMTAQRDQLANRVDTMRSESARLAEDLRAAARELDDTRTQLADARRRFATLQQQHTDTRSELDRLRIAQTQRDRELAQAQTRLQESDQQLSELESEYQTLKVKYDKLVRPARTAAGKHVVEVRYSKPGGALRIEYRLPGNPQFTAVSRDKLDALLSRLTDQYPDQLYVKVIIPENSGLSYNEAWTFTSHLHRNYDYYFKAKPEKAVVVE